MKKKQLTLKELMVESFVTDEAKDLVGAAGVGPSFPDTGCLRSYFC